MDFNFHGSPFHFIFKRDSRSVKMTGSFPLNWSASLILFMTITQSKSECFFSAVPFAMDPPYKDKVGMQNLFIAGIFSVTFVLHIFATSRLLILSYSSRSTLRGPKVSVYRLGGYLMTLISFLFICNQLKLRIFSNTFQSSAFDQTCLNAYITCILYLNARNIITIFSTVIPWIPHIAGCLTRTILQLSSVRSGSRNG